jgi:peptide/nickel transport system ATP-binding protein
MSTDQGRRPPTPRLVVEDVSKTYTRRRGGRAVIRAVDHVSFEVAPGTAVALVGQSGSGKSTLARLVTGSERPTSGSVRLGEIHIERLSGRGLRALHRDVQIIFQDPYGALNPLHTVGYTVSRPAINLLGLSPEAAAVRTRELLERVGLTPPAQIAAKLPHQLSGGQRQRVVIARALASEPKLLVADEPVSMLDVSLRAGVLRLLASLREEQGLSLLYITHDLLSARVITDEILVLEAGRVVERGRTVDVLRHPHDPYTVRLLDAIPVPARRLPVEGRGDGASAGHGQRTAGAVLTASGPVPIISTRGRGPSGSSPPSSSLESRSAKET